MKSLKLHDQNSNKLSAYRCPLESLSRFPEHVKWPARSQTWISISWSMSVVDGTAQGSNASELIASAEEGVLEEKQREHKREE